MSKNFGDMKHMNTSKIIGIQFSLMSPEEIRKGSVAEITSRDTYINNKPVINGLFDPRMGVLERGLICPTDGLDYIQTPGYFGHIELARPLFLMQYFSTIQKILNCVCFKCSKLLIKKDKYKHALDMTAENRWKYVYKLASDVKRCGEDTEDGCGYLQPKSIKKEGLATLIALWDTSTNEGSDTIEITLTPELVLKIFKRISDEDVTFMGFSPVFSRPNWMLCEVLAVPPPAVRPSVKHDAQQRSEDDLSHILVNIIKTNKTLQEKIQNNASENVINDYTTILQYYVGSQVDNKLPGANPVAQRSGRPLKSIKDRLNGKGGRMRGNLMAKRVDFSARSVISADPNISIRELGIPLKIAKNITKPIIVNKVNRDFLTKLVQNGTDIYPGAKIWEKKNGETITLRDLDRNSIKLEYGDIIHRHMMNGDAILFNRQPTLHRMSMMSHIARIMSQGDTFRMNVADTKPYNADFDGDEMNLHMPQDQESETELRKLAAVPYQIISPGNNSPIIGIYQDSMLGCFRFSRPNINFSQKDAMNLLMMFKKTNILLLKKSLPTDLVTNFEILSQILPPMSLKVKNKKFDFDKDKNYNENNVIEIKNGQYLRGQMDKGILGSGTKGLIHRACNDFGNMAASDFIDDLQNIITEYMKSSGFSVGIGDLITTEKTNEDIKTVISAKKQEANNVIQQVQLGLFVNDTGKTNEEEFEIKMNNILSKAQSDAGRIALKGLSDDNRFVIMFEAGSKGSEINIQQMTSCLGQQNVDGKRIPYGFENRTLPHYTKFDDSPAARGFVENSYINGLTPQELYFHAMGGRVGLIDTAVKTSTTGYIQRRLIKGLEDLMINYDMTIRTNKSKLVQFVYGDDSIDTIKVENQELPIIEMTIQDIFEHFNLQESANIKKTLQLIYVDSAFKQHKKTTIELNNKCKKYTDFILDIRNNVVKNIFNNKSDKIVRVPVAFAYIISNIVGQQNLNSNSLTDICMYDAFLMIEHSYSLLEKIRFAPPTQLFKVLYYYYLSPKDLIINKRFNKRALQLLLDTIILNYKRAIVAPGEMVGMIAAQSIGEPATQMTLNTFHFAGVASKSNVTRGVPRIEEILNLTSNIKNPSLTIYLRPEDQQNKEKAASFQYLIEHTKLKSIVKSIEICFDPDDLNTLIDDDKQTMLQYNEFEKIINECNKPNVEGENKADSRENSKWIVRMELDASSMLDKNVTMDDVNFALNNVYNDDIKCVYSDYNSDKLIFRIRMNNIISSKTHKKKSRSLDQTDQIYILKNFQEQLLNNVVLRGVKNISKVNLRKIKDNLIYDAGTYKKDDIWVLDTIGINLLTVLGLNYIDATKTHSNDINEIHNVLGMEAARQTIYNELADVIEFDGTYLNYHHMALLCDRMTFSNSMISIYRHGINNDNIGPIAKASFEETPEMFLKAAKHAELDNMRGISANIMCGQEGLFGTSAFQVVLDLNEIIKLSASQQIDNKTDEAIINESFFEGTESQQDYCGMHNLIINNNVININSEECAEENDYNPFV